MASSPLEPRHSSTNKHNKHRRADTQVGQRKERRQEKIRKNRNEKETLGENGLPSAYRGKSGDNPPTTASFRTTKTKTREQWKTKRKIGTVRGEGGG